MNKDKAIELADFHDKLVTDINAKISHIDDMHAKGIINHQNAAAIKSNCYKYFFNAMNCKVGGNG